MSSVNEQEMEDGVFEQAKSACVALVPLTSAVDRAPKFANTRPDANFVTQLIATAERLPQTRQLRRAAPADALSAYRSFAESIRSTCVSTPQTI